MKISLREHGKGWHFKISGVEFQTDRLGEGLFVWTEEDSGACFGWRQIMGTCDFSLPPARRLAYRKIHYNFIEKEEFNYEMERATR